MTFILSRATVVRSLSFSCSRRETRVRGVSGRSASSPRGVWKALESGDSCRGEAGRDSCRGEAGRRSGDAYAPAIGRGDADGVVGDSYATAKALASPGGAPSPLAAWM